MKKTALLLGAALSFMAALPPMAAAQRACGIGIQHQRLAVENPELLKSLREQHRQRVNNAMSLTGAAAKSTSAQHPIPVVFHFILTPDQYNTIGRDTGIRRRVHSQLKVINEDFNGKNGDSNLIPGPFKSLYADANIQFGLARGTNSNTISDGIEVRVLPAGTPPVYDAFKDCYNAKSAPDGLPAWDVDKYLNIWVVNVTAGGGTIVGVTTSPGRVGLDLSGHIVTADEKGVVLNYAAVGAREFPAQHFIAGIDRGRTLTHELGHYFGLWHIWGDDFGACPSSSGGQDDDIADTPPQGNPNYSSPTFPKTDPCSPNSPGVMFMNYLDYVDDRAMMMFTHGQVQVMRATIMVDSESYSLTQNPQLLLPTGITPAVSEHAFRVSPNPANDLVHIALSGAERLLRIDVLNLMGQRVAHVAADHRKDYQLSLGSAPRGIYFVQCHFAEGTLTKKIVLQ